MEIITTAENTTKVGSVSGSELQESVVDQALGNDPDVAMKCVIDSPDFLSGPLTVNKTVTSTGVRICAPIMEDASEESNGGESVSGLKRKVEVKEESDVGVVKEETDCIQPSGAKKGKWEMFDELLRSTNTKVMASDEYLEAQSKQSEEAAKLVDDFPMKIKDEPDVGFVTEESATEEVGLDSLQQSESEEATPRMSLDEHPRSANSKVMSEEESCRAQIKQEAPKELEEAERDDWSKAIVVVKEEPEMRIENQVSAKGIESNGIQPLKLEEEQGRAQIKQEMPTESEEANWHDETMVIIRVKEEPDLGIENNASMKQETIPDCPQPISIYDPFAQKRTAEAVNADTYRSVQRPSYKKKEWLDHRRSLSCAVLENGDFPEEPDWLLVGRNAVTGLSTTKGSKLVDNEIVHFAFPSPESSSKSFWMNSRAAAASSGIVRFSTKRYGEIGRLPMEWGKCLIPLVNSTKVKVLGRCVAAPSNLHLMQEIMLYVSFYIHLSVFTEGDKSSWRLEAPHIDSTMYPLLTLFKLLKIKPFQKAEFTPEDLDSRKRSLNLEGDSEEAALMLPAAKRGKASQQYPEQSKDEQAVSESSLNKLVGAADLYNLEEMEPPQTLICTLKPYQKQALYWMSESEKGIDAEKAAETLHPCWAAYRICDERASAIYVNTFSGEATTHFPTATQMARGGILADAMGLGKTVMTIALILARPDRGSLDGQNGITDTADDIENMRRKKKVSHTKASSKGGTLIVCPMALLGQWKDELETHSKPDSISIFVHYGGDKTSDPAVMSEHDVVLTTYGVLSAAYKSDSEYSIFHRVDWYRVVLDEAHTIKSSKTIGAQAAYALSSHCRWCLTGTPLQNNLEDIFSLLCFLHVEPWCNWAWWNKLIQRPYESGDLRGLKLIKAILRPLMLRRTKETKDKEGRPILVLPPTDIQIIECEQSEAEHDFYDALFRRSKVQFDQFVEQGKVLHNYASILELLLRLRQCCNHPFLVMSRADSQKYTDLNKLAKRFLETSPNCAHPSQSVPSRAYIEEVVEDIRRGENTECPICLESADDPVLTPCAHRMCRECLLSSWRTPSTGLCPICRKLLKKNDLITCPSENKFRVDVEKNWKESSKVKKLLDCLERLRQSGSQEKSIVFSQWTSFFDLLEIPLRRKGVEFLRFDGRLAQKQRERVLKEFSESEEKMVLLMSLKAGGVGLNLTAASNVFLMDPWWNPAVEEQAIMRIHRIGQKRTVCVRRFIVKDTVEERMQQVQARKQRMIAGALTDEEVRSARIEELKMLFR